MSKSVHLGGNALDRASRLRKARKIDAVLSNFGDGLHGRRVLDIGTGAGIIAGYLAERARAVVAVDVVDKRIETSVPFLLVGDENLPFNAASFDIVVSNLVIEHVKNQENHLREMRRVLVQGGVCYLAAPNRYTLIEDHYKLPLLSWPPPGARNLYLKIAKGQHPYDIKPLTHRELAQQVSQAGFEIQDVSLDLIKHPETYALGSGLVRQVISLLPRWFLRLMRPILPTFVLLLRKGAPS